MKEVKTARKDEREEERGRWGVGEGEDDKEL